MTSHPIHITLVTLGVSDVQASAVFYEKLGFEQSHLGFKIKLK